MDILQNQLFTGGILLGGITTLLYSLKHLGEKVLVKLKDRFIFRVVIYDYDELFYVLEDYILSNHPKKYKNLEVSYEKTRRWTRGIDDEETVSKYRKLFYKQEPNIFTIKYKGKRLFFSKDKKELEHATDFRSMLNFHYSISAWRGQKIIKELMEDLTTSYNKTLNEGKINVYTTIQDDWRISNKKYVKTIDKVILNGDTKNFIVKDLNQFKEDKAWYKNVNITYKRSYLLYGPPGTGKTTLAQAIASYCERDICCLNLNSIQSDTMLISLFSKIPDNTVLVIEDIDCVFKKRIPTSKDIKITFSCLLNCLDGIISKDNIITIVTTNHIENLDEALIRAGRMDVQLEIPLAQTQEVNEYLTLFYSEKIEIDTDILLNMSKVQEICIQNKENSFQAINDILLNNKLQEVHSNICLS